MLTPSPKASPLAFFFKARKPLLVLMASVFLTACGAQSIKQSTTEITLSPCLNQYQGAHGPIKYGYGEGRTLVEAKQQAYSDIAQQFGVSIRSSNQSIQKKIDTHVSQEFRSELLSHASAKLDELKTVCMQRHNGLLTLTLAYDTRPLYQQVADKFVEQWLSKSHFVELIGPRPLLESNFSVDLKQALQGDGPQRQLHISLENQNGWYLNVEQQRWRLDNSQLLYLVNWYALQKGELEFKATGLQGHTLPQQIYSGTEFRLEINKQAENSYLHILGLYEDGSVDIVRQNLSGQTQRTIPKQGIFEAATIENGQRSSDVYLALVTENPLQRYGNLAQLLTQNIKGNEFQHLYIELEKAALAMAPVIIEVLP